MEKQTTIADFIKENYKQLEIIGILGAIVGLFNSAKTSWINYLFSFFILTCIVLIWLEMKKWIHENDSLKLEFFKFFFNFSIVLLILYIILKYRTITWLGLFLPITIGVLYLGAKLILRFDYFNRIKKSGHRKDKIIAFMIILAVILVSTFVGITASIPLNIFFDVIISRFPI